jgi:hypothetical protein
VIHFVSTVVSLLCNERLVDKRVTAEAAAAGASQVCQTRSKSREKLNQKKRRLRVRSLTALDEYDNGHDHNDNEAGQLLLSGSKQRAGQQRWNVV